MRSLFCLLISLKTCLIFSQTKSSVVIKGIVYISSSRSQGVMNGKTISEPQQLFKNQNIYFNNDTIQLIARTDSTGAYSIQLSPGSYNVYQELGVGKSKSGSMIYGSYGLKISEGGMGHDIFFKNTVNGRSTEGNMEIGIPSKQDPNKKRNKQK